MSKTMWRWILLAGAPAVVAVPVLGADLPVPAEVFVTSGEAMYREQLAGFENRAVIDQVTDRAILNWQEFNVAEGHKVTYVQPRDISVALNRIMQQSPSRILGAIETRVGRPGASVDQIDKMPVGGQIYLINPNGFVFGADSTINTNTLLASSLNITDEVFSTTGLAGALQNGEGIAALTAFESGSGEILIEQGAQITTTEGGRILLIAPRISNAGTLKTPGGQTLLAAAENRVYLEVFPGNGVRGFTVEVEVGGEVENLGEIIAERGNITLAGLLLEQQGVLRATTSVDENGSIDLLARDIESSQPGGNIRREGGRNQVFPERTGTITAAGGSVTEVLADRSSEATGAIDKPQGRSTISFMGREVRFASGARVTAEGGDVVATATNNPATFKSPGVEGPVFVESDASLVIEADVVIDASGTTDTVLPMSRNEVEVELRSNELADSPQQRGGAAQGQPVTVDARRGTQFAAVEGAIGNIQRSVEERLSIGGSILLQSEGEVRVESGALLDISGGSVTYQDGFVAATQVIVDGEVVDIANADPDRPIDGIFNGATKTHDAWGVTESFADNSGATNRRYERGYLEGKDAGSLRIAANDLELGGEIRGGVSAGRYQREAPEPLESDDTGAKVARRYRQIPEAGRVQLQLDAVPASAVDVTLADSGPADAGESTVLVDAGLLARSGIAGFQLTSRGNLLVDETVDLQLGGGFHLELLGRSLTFDGKLSSPSGRFTLRGRIVDGIEDGMVRLGEGAILDTAGLWVNDYAFRPSPSLTPAWIEGGSVTLRTPGDLILAANAAIDVSGGAWLQSDGTLVDGLGGSIALATTGPDTRFIPSINLVGHALRRGGSLRLESNALGLFERTQGSAGPIIVGPPVGEDDFPILEPFPDLDFVSKVDAFIPSSMFQLGGFEQIELASNRDGLVVAAGSRIEARQINFELRPGYLQAASGAPMSSVARTTLLPDYLRRPVQIQLRYNRPDGPLDPRSGIVMLPGSAVDAGPAGGLTLSSTGSIWVQGGLGAAGGDLTLEILPPAEATTFNPLQSIHVDETARLDVHGALIARPSATGLRRGTVLDGGDIRIDARQGFVFVAPGALLDVGGTAAELDLPVTEPGRFASRFVASDAGSVFIRSAEGGALGGTVLAVNDRLLSRGDGLGGRFELVLDGNQRAIPLEATERSYSDAPRQLALLDEIGEFGADFGIEPAARYRDRFEIAPSELDRLGFDAITLRVRNLEPRFGAGGVPLIQATDGIIRFESDFDQQFDRSLSLFAPILQVADGVTARVGAPLLRFGYDQVLIEGIAGSASPGSGSLALTGEFVELVGSVRLQGTAELDVSSETDIRLRGVLSGLRSRDLVGQLAVAGDLALSAARLYPTTLSSFTLDVTGGLRYADSGGSAEGPVYSYGGGLTLSAASLHVDGRILVPGGSLDLDASGDVSLGEQALLTTALGAELQLFGQTQAGLDWIYQYPDGTIDVVERLDSPRIVVEGERVSTAEGSRIDTSGGGDLLAYEFIAGPGGSVDALAPANIGDGFVILPESRLPVAPYDEFESRAFPYEPDMTVRLEAGAGLPAGDYAILPARYALLPGAVIVRPVSGQVDLVPGEVRSSADGFPIVAGRLAVAGREQDRLRGFQLQPGRYARELSEYDLTLANSYFDSGHRPADAGNVTLDTRGDFDLGGTVATAADSALGGVTGSLSLVAPALAVFASEAAADASELLAEGYTSLLADELAELEVSRLILGARVDDSDDEEAQSLDVATNRLLIDEAVTLAADELLLAATREITIADEVLLLASGTAPAGRTLNVDRAVSVVAASAGELDLLRTGAATDAGGRVTLASTARVEGAGSVVVQAPETGTIDGALVTDGGSVGIYSRSLQLSGNGAAPPDVGIGLTAEHLAGFSADRLVLSAGESIAIRGEVTLRAGEIALDAPQLRPDAVGSGLDLNATAVVLGNSSDAAPGAAAIAGGELAIRADSLELSGGESSLSGFRSADVLVNGALHLERDSVLNVAGADDAPADLTISAGRLLVADGADARLAASGGVRIDSSGVPAPVPETVGLGGRLEVRGASVSVGTAIDARSGRVGLVATEGDVVLTDGARIDVSGLTIEGQIERIATPGGRVVLQAGRDVAQASGAAIDVGGPELGGALAVSAPTGEAALAGMLTGGPGGDFSVDAGTIVGLSSLNESLLLGNFDGDVSYRVRQGDLTFGPGDSVGVEQFAAVADAGSVTFAGTLQLMAGGRAQLDAGRDAVFSGSLTGRDARLDVNALGNGGRAHFDPVDAAGFTGKVSARISAVGDLEDRMAVVAGDGYESIAELVTVIDVADGVFDVDDQALARDVLSALAAQDADIRAALNLADGVYTAQGLWVRAPGALSLTGRWDLSGWRFASRPGRLLVTAGGDLAIDGGLNDGFGLDTRYGFPVERLLDERSWSYQLVAGADPSALSSGAVIDGAGSLLLAADTVVRTGTGSLDLRAGSDLVLADQTSTVYSAGTSTGVANFSDEFRFFLLHDVEFPENGGAVDVQVAGDIVGAPSSQLFSQYMSRFGGTWLGGPAPTMFGVSFTTFSDFGIEPTFQQGIASFGGGSIRIEAGGDISDLSVIAPALVRHVGDASGDTASLEITFSDNTFEIVGPTRVDVRAGGDVVGGVLYAGSGSATLSAGNRVRPSDSGLGTLLATSRGDLSVWGNRGAFVESAFDPTMVTQSLGFGPPLLQLNDERTFFFSYGAESRVAVQSVTGDAVLGLDTTAIVNRYDFTDGVVTYGLQDLGGGLVYPGQALDELPLNVLPGTVRLGSARGSVELSDDAILFPESRGGLSVFAYDSIRSPEALSEVLISDADARLLPSLEAPQGNLEQVETRLQSSAAAPSDIHAAVPVHAEDTEPTTIEALTGDIATPSLSIVSAEAVQIVAARDLNLRVLSAQNNRPGDVTLIQSGGDIRLLANRDDEGRVSPDDKVIEVAGPGTLNVVAGRSIDLGTSVGIVTTGDLDNPALADAGADVLVLTGNSDAPAYDDFLASYPVSVAGAETVFSVFAALLTEDADSRGAFAELIGRDSLAAEEVPEALAALDDDELLAAADGLAGQSGIMARLTLPQKRALSFSALSAVLAESGTEASQLIAQSAPGVDVLLAYRGGFVALETLFPKGIFVEQDADYLFAEGDQADDSIFASATSEELDLFFSEVPETLRLGPVDATYSGDLALFFSRIATLDGGNMDLVVPGGLVNVGLTVSFGTGKSPDELGIVAQDSGSIDIIADGNIEVNRSRIFTLNGGDISIWSTNGDIDAGRGAKTTLATPTLVAVLGENDSIQKVVPPAVSGSGIAADDGSSGNLPNILLSTPQGVVDAGDAGIRTPGRLFTAASDVVGRDNIDVGSFVGSPAGSVTLSVADANLGASASSAVQSIADASAEEGGAAAGDDQDRTEEALGWLEVFLEGFGPEFCDPQDDPQCGADNG